MPSRPLVNHAARWGRVFQGTGEPGPAGGAQAAWSAMERLRFGAPCGWRARARPGTGRSSWDGEEGVDNPLRWPVLHDDQGESTWRRTSRRPRLAARSDAAETLQLVSLDIPAPS